MYSCRCSHETWRLALDWALLPWTFPILSSSILMRCPFESFWPGFSALGVVDQYNGIIDTGRIISRGTVSGIGEQIATNAWCSPGPWPKPYIFPLELRPSGAAVSCQEVFQAGHLSCWTVFAPNSPIRDPSQNCPSSRTVSSVPWLENQPWGNFRWENPHILCFGNLWNLQNPSIFPRSTLHQWQDLGFESESDEEQAVRSPTQRCRFGIFWQIVWAVDGQMIPP